MNCSNLHTIKISSCIESIAEQVFDGCFKLENIIVGSNNHYCVTNNILIDKSERKVLRVANKGNAEIAIPDGITVICDRAFDRNLTERISLSKSVARFSQKSFFECYKLKEFYVNRKNPSYSSLGGVLHSKDRTKLILYPIGKDDTNYFLEDDVTEICNSAFSKAAHLISITFNTMIKNIGTRAFEYCQSLESIMLDFDRISDIDEVREFDKEKEKAKVEELRKAEAQKAEEERRRVELEHGINSTPNGEETENKPAEKVVCAACGAIIDDDATHCGDCGAKVETETTTDTTVVAEAIDTAEVIEGEETIIAEAEETTAYDEECIVVTKPDI